MDYNQRYSERMSDRIYDRGDQTIGAAGSHFKDDEPFYTYGITEDD